MTKIYLVGATGRMGQALQNVASENKALKIVGGVGKGNKEFTSTFPTKAPKIEVVVDFSSIDIFVETLNWCAKNQLPLVSGVTGLSDDHQKALRKISKQIPVLWSPNMSVGVAIMKKILSEMAMPKDFDVHLLEYHHRHKKDAPSGTAKDLESVLKKKTTKYTGASSIRGGGIFGVHRVDLMAESEVITIQHQALDRNVFAKGALAAAEWLVGKKPGLYTMQDFLSS